MDERVTAILEKHATRAKSNREARRAAHPELAAWVDDIRAHFPEARISYTKMEGYEWGNPSPQGVRAVISERSE